MKFKLEMDCGNAAFGEDDAGRTYEVAYILRKVGYQLDEGSLSGKCVDDNGNTVGTYQFVEEGK